MDIARGPVQTPSLLESAGPAHASDSHALTEAVAALPPDERSGLDRMTASVATHLDQIRASGVVPEGFEGALMAYDQVLESLGLPVPASQADARALLATSTGQVGSAETRSVAAHAAEPLPPVAQPPAGSALSLDGRRDTVEPTREPDPEIVRQASIVFGNALSRDIRNLDVVVTKADLDRITETVRSLSPENAQAVYDRLSGSERERWAAELTADYTPAERSELYGLLVERFDTSHLLNFAYYNEHDASTGVDGRLFGEAVAAHAPEAVAEAFVWNATHYTISPEARGTGGQNPAFEARREIGAAGAAALAGLHGPAFDRALDSLRQAERVGAIVERAVHSELHTDPVSGTSWRTVDADTLGSLLQTARTSQNALGKATLVNEASLMLGRVEGTSRLVVVAPGDSVDQIRDGITGMLCEDPIGVLQALEQDVAKYGGGLTSYMRSMLRSDQSDDVGNLLVRLGTNNGDDVSSAEWITTHGVGDIDNAVSYPNARALGYAVGSLRAAIAAQADDARERGEIVKGVFGTAAGVAGAANFGAGAVATVLTGSVDLVADAVVDEAVRQGVTLEGTLFRLAFPRNPDKSLYNGPAQNDFDQAASNAAKGIPLSSGVSL